jgi:hypothetical protein
VYLGIYNLFLLQVVAEYTETFTPDRQYVVVADSLPPGDSELLADVQLYLCSTEEGANPGNDDRPDSAASGICFAKHVKFGVPVTVDEGEGGEDDFTVTFSAAIKKPF